MKRFLLVVTAMVLALVFCGTARGNDRNQYQLDERRFIFHRHDYHPLESPSDFYRDGYRPLDSPFDFYRDGYRPLDSPFEFYQDDLPLRFNDYCFRVSVKPQHLGILLGQPDQQLSSPSGEWLDVGVTEVPKAIQATRRSRSSR